MRDLSHDYFVYVHVGKYVHVCAYVCFTYTCKWVHMLWQKQRSENNLNFFASVTDHLFFPVY